MDNNPHAPNTRPRGKVTFGRMEPISAIPGDDKCADVIVDGEIVGEIRATMVDALHPGDGTRVGSYTADLEDGDGFDSADYMTVVGGGTLTARAALKAARDYARNFYAVSA